MSALELALMRLLALLALVPSLALAQSNAAPRYRPTRDTVRYDFDNPFRMYWLRGADSLGWPGHRAGVVMHAWKGTDARPIVVVRTQELDVGRRLQRDSFVVSRRGRVMQVNDSAPSPMKRVDLLLMLPDVPLVVGTRWSDSVGARGAGAQGEDVYQVTRSYRVARLVDTLGRRLAEVTSEGTVHMRASYVIDSAAHKVAWMDVSGPVTERWLFDPARGRLASRTWTMDLRGKGVPPEGGDTVPAGLRSDMTIRERDGPRVRWVLEPLPGTDTSVTVDVERGGVILLHTVRRGRDTITSSLVRNDGLVGVATSSFGAGARLDRYEATWADSTSLLTHRLVRTGDMLVLSATGTRDTTIGAPSGRWGVADYAMQEQLVPLLLGVPRGAGAEPIAVFRPHARKWDVGTVTAEERAGLVVITLRWDDERSATPEILIISPEGDYLFGENAGPTSGRRVPSNAARVQRLMAAMEELKRRT